MLIPIFAIALCLYVRSVQATTLARNERIAVATISAIEKNIDFQRQIFEQRDHNGN